MAGTLIAIALYFGYCLAQHSSGNAGSVETGWFPTALAAGGASDPGQIAVEVSAAVRHDVSPPLRSIAPLGNPEPPKLPHDKPLGRIHPNGPLSTSPDPVIQSSAGPLVGTSASLNVLGVGNGFVGPAGSFTVNSAPPDTNASVGATQVVEWVNESFAVFDKATGAVVYGPTAGNTLWSGFGGGCQTNNDGDPIAQFDKAANRWVMTQFSVSTTPYLQCIAISQTSDATGSYYRYAFQMPNFNDYPKLGVWPDGYYATFNMFNGNSFVGARACAFDRTSMLSGAAATSQCFQLSSSFGGLLPSDLDGVAPPPAGSPNYFLNFGTNSLNLWKFHVDWANSANSTFTGPTNIPVAAFSEACGGGACIPQSGSRAASLDSLGDRLMYRLAYRNFGDHESLVVNHSVTAGSSVGVRWYELRSPGGTPTVYQQSTYAPDANFRWMGSIAMDRVGDIALGYSVSSSTMVPAIRYTGRVPTDQLGTMETETSIFEGGGSQLKNLNRWGDYSSLSIDPVDDCTFWYANEYLQSSGTFNWSTRLASFKFPSCPMNPPSIVKVFAASQVIQNDTTILNFSIANSNAAALSGVAFNDAFPAGLIVATPNGVSGSCGGGTITATAGSSSVNLSGAVLPPNSSCTFAVNVVPTKSGIVSNSVTVSSLDAGTGNTSSASINVIVPLAITTASLPDGTQNSAYFAALTATGGTSPYHWSIVSGTLPAGLFLSSKSSAILGTSTTPGTSTFTLQVDDLNSKATQQVTQAFSITVK